MNDQTKPGWIRHLITFLVVFALAGVLFFRKPTCMQQGQQVSIPEDARVVEVWIKDWRLRAEVADTPELRRRGLAGRQKLERGYGMLFVFPDSDVRSFWMKDTTIPLSIAFIKEDGRIVKIAQMESEDLTAVSSEQPVKYALEARQGWFADRDIQPGATCRLPSVLPPPPGQTDTPVQESGPAPEPEEPPPPPVPTE
jgi:hypothetical protein